jgi:hypothetical protein
VRWPTSASIVAGVIDWMGHEYGGMRSVSTILAIRERPDGQPLLDLVLRSTPVSREVVERALCRLGPVQKVPDLLVAIMRKSELNRSGLRAIRRDPVRFCEAIERARVFRCMAKCTTCQATGARPIWHLRQSTKALWRSGSYVDGWECGECERVRVCSLPVAHFRREDVRRQQATVGA